MWTGEMRSKAKKIYRGRHLYIAPKHVAPFAKDLVAHMETDGQGAEEGHMANPFAECPVCRERIHIKERY